MLLAADGTVTFVSQDGRQFDPTLRPGLSVERIDSLRAAWPTIAEARRSGRATATIRFGAQLWQVDCEASSGGGNCLLTLTRGPHEMVALGRPVLDLVDVVLSGQKLERVLDELCRAAETAFPRAVCSVMVLGGDRLLHPTGGPNLPAPLVEACRGLEPVKGNGSCGEAVWLGQPIFSQSALDDVRFRDFLPVLEATGIRSCWSWPIVNFSGEVLGSFAAYGYEPGLPSQAQRELMQTMVRFGALAIERSYAQRETRDVLDRYHLVAEASTNVIYDWNLRSNALDWSPRMAQVFGYEESSSLNFGWWESCLHAADRDRVLKSLDDALRDRCKTWSDSYRFRRKNGSWATVIDRGHVLFDDDGTPIRLIGEMSDVSGQQQLQARLALTERLASVGTLAAGVAHEINNPLAWISSNLQYALEELTQLRATTSLPLLDEVNEALKDARVGAERVTTIVRDLKLFARAQDDSAGLVDVRRVLESSITMARNEIRHRAHLERRFDDVPMVKANEGKLSQVFLNLLINAAHAVPEGDVANHCIAVSTGLDARGQVVVQVRDTGQGIEQDVLPHIFDPFFTTKPVGQGTGLGLSICHSIITGLGGTISVDSVPGRGSTFRVTLPVAAMESQRTPPPQAPPPEDHRGLVALIDDEPAVLAALQRVLGPQHEVHTFSDPVAALERLPTLRPDVIFCDVMMPELSGAELYNRLLSTHPLLASRLVFMTGGAFSATAREFLDQVQRPVIDKPFTAETVRRLTIEHVARARERSEALH